MSQIKSCAGLERVKLAEVVPLDTPFTLNLFVSNRCNFRCNYCAQSLGAQGLKKAYHLDNELMSLETVKNTVEQAKKFPHKFKMISISGQGEPLCNPDLAKMVALLKEGNIAEKITVITNGSLLTPERGLELIEAGVDIIRISIQGISSKKYKEISNVTLDFDRLIGNIAYLYQHKKNCQIFVKTVDQALEEGEDKKFYEIFSKISDRMYIEQVKPVYDAVNYSDKANNLSINRYGMNHERRKVCPEPFYMLTVWSDGEVAPCCTIYRACPLGNVNKDSLIELWNSNKHKAFCKLQLEDRRNTHEACKRCCAPDDVVPPEDVLDDAIDKLLPLYS